MTFVDIVFLTAATVCLISGLLIVMQRNPVYSVVYMLPLFLGMTTIFWLLSATFLAAMQMMVYGGAILVVFLFVIMLINLRPEEIKDDFGWVSWGLPGGAAGVLWGVISGYVLQASEFSSKVPVVNGETVSLTSAFNLPVGPRDGHVFGSIENIAMPLFNKYVVPFEVASILICVAILGAVLLSKRRI
jgi:NADH-quinone oxidoreductase subunit J